MNSEGKVQMVLSILLLVLIIILSIAFFWVLVPFVLMKVLAVFGVMVSFWMALGIMLLVYVLVALIK